MTVGSRPRAVLASTSAYDLGDGAPFDEVGTVPAGTNVLLLGPALTGTADLAFDVLTTGAEHGEHALVVTADEPAERVRGRFERAGGNGRLCVVDCSGASGKGSFDDAAGVKYVPSPGDLTGIGIGIAKCSQAAGADRATGVRTGIVTLSTILQYVDLETAFSFVHVLTGRLAAAGYLGVATLDPTLHDAVTVNTLVGQFDAVVELRDGEGGREARIRGLPDGPDGWFRG